jgi:hypothetical protein
MADEDPVMPGNFLPARVIRTDDEPPTDLNTIGAMTIPREETRRSLSFFRSEQIHKIILLREVNCMSWGRISAELQVKQSTAQSTYERWHQAGVFKRAMGRHRSRKD